MLKRKAILPNATQFGCFAPHPWLIPLINYKRGTLRKKSQVCQTCSWNSLQVICIYPQQILFGLPIYWLVSQCFFQIIIMVEGPSPSGGNLNCPYTQPALTGPTWKQAPSSIKAHLSSCFQLKALRFCPCSLLFIFPFWSLILFLNKGLFIYTWVTF